MGFDILGELFGRLPAFDLYYYSSINSPWGTPLMSDGRTAPILQYIRKLAESQTTVRLPDRELLRRFAREHDEDAFAVLVRRHGPMVWHVCARVLGTWPGGSWRKCSTRSWLGSPRNTGRP
jgi:hypothetical protein